MKPWFALISLLLAGCLPLRPRADRVDRIQPLLGTYVSITAYGPRPATESAVADAFAEIRRVDQLLSVHRTDSEASHVNRHAASGPVGVSPDFLAVVIRAQAIATQSEGAFAITVGPLSRLWGFLWKEYRLPSPDEINPVLPACDFRKLGITTNPSTVRFLHPAMSLDFGGIGKGVAVDAAVESLKKHGVRAAMVKAGGDLRVFGTPPGKSAWTVFLEDPCKKGNRLPIRLTEGALSTSGNYENFFVVDGRRYAHIVDPRTGLPVAGVAACTVTAPTCAESDAWATAFFVLGPNRSGEVTPIGFNWRFVLPDAASRPQVRSSPGFPLTPSQASNSSARD